MHHASIVSYVVSCTLAVIALAVNTVSVPAQPTVDARPNARKDPRDTILRSAYDDRIDIVSLGIEYAASAGGGSFFTEYQKLGGKQSDLGTYVAPNLSGRVVIADELRLIANVSYHSAKFADSYEIRLDTSRTAPATAGITENFSMLAIPILAGLEISPIRNQFTSYVGLAAGLAITRAKWESALQFSNGGYNRPQRNIDAMGVAPAVRAYAGVDLRFDRPSENRSTFRGIFLEASYLFLPVTRDYFAELRARGDGIDEGPETDDASLYLGGLSFTFGLNLQVLRQ